MPDLQPTLPTLKAGPKAEGGGRLPVAGGGGGGGEGEGGLKNR